MIKLVSFEICPFVQRVTGMLAAKNVGYDIEYIQLNAKSKWFLDISPIGQVPVLITEEGEALHESDAIVEYIEEITEPLIAGLNPIQRAKDRAWSYQASKHYLAQCSAMQSEDKETLIKKMVNLSKAFGKAEKQFGEGPFFNGQVMGNVDIAWLPLLHRALLVKDHSGYDMLELFPKISAWQKSMMKTGLPDKTVSEDFLEKFHRFYLTKETFLGRGADFNENYVP
ncbi:glutathione S-transferase family protein [Amphritea sp.]|uniref:glutathione S-transferase family protein n=1 Tax=Amphritea sp. TaxID=1872502 RepID=UPI003A91E552